MLDVQFRHPDGHVERIHRVCPVQTRVGAERYERELRQALLEGEYGKETREARTLNAFQVPFLEWSQNNNKPSQVYCKRHVLKNHLLPAFGRMKLDEIKLQDIESYKAKKLKDGLSPKTADRFSASPELNRLQRFIVAGVGEPADRLLGREQRSRKLPGQPFEPRGGVDRVADHRELEPPARRADVPGDHRPGVNADPHRERRELPLSPSSASSIPRAHASG